MNKKDPIKLKDLPEEMTGKEGLSSQINIAQMSEAINVFFWTLANKHSMDELRKTLRKFRGKPFGFWRKSPPQHSGNK